MRRVGGEEELLLLLRGGGGMLSLQAEGGGAWTRKEPERRRGGDGGRCGRRSGRRWHAAVSLMAVCVVLWEVLCVGLVWFRGWMVDDGEGV